MNIAARKSQLLHALKVLSTTADPKSTIPALGCVLIEVNGRSIAMTTTDLTNTVQINIDVDHAFPWVDRSRVCVPLKALKDAVRSCTKGSKRSEDVPVMLEWNAQNLTVSAPRSARLTLEGINPDLFPDVNQPRGEAADYVAYDNLHEALAFVSPAVCQDETRFHLNSVAFVGTDIVATDGCRLHRQANMPKVPGRDNVNVHPFGHLVPMGTIKALRAGTEDKFGKVFAWFREWKYSDSWRQKPSEPGFAVFQFYYKRCHHNIWCKTVDAQFPPYEQVIPREPRAGFEINRELLENVCQAARKSAEYGRGLGFDNESPNFLRASVDNPARKMAMSVEAKIDGMIKICLDPRYLLEAVQALPTDTVSIRLDSERDAPVRIDAPNRVAVIMPMRRD